VKSVTLHDEEPQYLGKYDQLVEDEGFILVEHISGIIFRRLEHLTDIKHVKGKCPENHQVYNY